MVQTALTNLAVIVPCYNEASRFDVDAFVGFAEGNPSVVLIFVDDGSHDETHDMLQSVSAAIGNQASVLRLSPNVGKGEAVRRGVEFVLHDSRFDPFRIGFVAYIDADLAIPLDELNWMHRRALSTPRIKAVVGIRLALLGHEIDRKGLRTWLSYAFSRLTQLCFGLGMRETQCGAKLFEINEGFRHVMADPFYDRWFFDIEIFVRLRRCLGTQFHASVYEHVLDRCLDRGTSRLRFSDFLTAPLRLVGLAMKYRRYQVPGQALPASDVANGSQASSNDGRKAA